MLYTMIPILREARKNNYGVIAPNVFDESTIRSVISAAENMHSPVIIDISETCSEDIFYLASIARYFAEKASVPVAVNLDHGGSYETIVKALAGDFTSVMIDRSTLPFEENRDQVREIVKMAHALGKSVEAELGHVGKNVFVGSEAESKDIDQQDVDSHLTNVNEAVQFVKETGVDCLAVAIGTVHGLYPKGYKPSIHFDLLANLGESLDIPLVLHGGSGSGDSSLQKACQEGICKVNVASDLLKTGKEYVARYNDAILVPVEKRDKMLGPYWAFLKGYQEKTEYYMNLFGSKGKG